MGFRLSPGTGMHMCRSYENNPSNRMKNLAKIHYNRNAAHENA